MDFYKKAIIYVILRDSERVPNEILLKANEDDYENLLAEYMDINSDYELKEYIEDFM